MTCWKLGPAKLEDVRVEDLAADLHDVLAGLRHDRVGSADLHEFFQRVFEALLSTVGGDGLGGIAGAR